MITDPNHACLAKMTGRRLQEELLESLRIFLIVSVSIFELI
jgi:hypothetical protein